MNPARLQTVTAVAAALLALCARGSEENLWPGRVSQKDEAGNTVSWTAAGPFAFSGPVPAPDKGKIHGVRPFYVRVESDGSVMSDFLYPLFFFREYPDSYRWSLLQLINGSGSTDYIDKNVPPDHHFDLWPFYFSHYNGDPEASYRAVLPIAGTVKYRLGYSRISWILFPLYAQTARHATTVTYTPFPFIRRYGGDETGFGIWPLFSVANGPGVARHRTYLWPFGWDNVTAPDPDSPPGTPPGRQVGILPFYTLETQAGFVSENYAWPFFGHSERTLPYRYSEKRYFWPFLVQGTGDDHSLDRVAPFYSHSDIRGLESTWYGWPFWHNTSWTDADVAQSKTQFFYFLYWNLDESSVSHPGRAHARKTHIWPLVSIWDNGAGSRQVQAPSPIEVFFPDNPDMRETWSPLFALYRSDQKPGAGSRSSLLWNAVTWKRDEGGALEEIHLGPLLGLERGGAGPHWTILGFDFPSKLSKDGGGTHR
jgi:hypothetical protein